MAKLDKNNLGYSCLSARLFSKGNGKQKSFIYSSHRGCCQCVAQGKPSQLYRVCLSGWLPVPILSSLSITLAWRFHRALHMLLTLMVFPNLRTLSDHCFSLKKEYVFSRPRLFYLFAKEWGEVRNQPFQSPRWRVLS